MHVLIRLPPPSLLFFYFLGLYDSGAWLEIVNAAPLRRNLGEREGGKKKKKRKKRKQTIF